MTKLIHCVDCFGNNALKHLKWNRNIGSYDQTLVWKYFSNNTLATSLNMESNSCFISFKLFNCLSLHHKRSQEHDFIPFFAIYTESGSKRVVWETFSAQILVIWPNIPVPFLSAEVHCYQLKSTKDTNLVILVWTWTPYFRGIHIFTVFTNFLLKNPGDNHIWIEYCDLYI